MLSEINHNRQLTCVYTRSYTPRMNIKEWLNETGHSQKWLGDQIGVTQVAVAKWCNKRVPAERVISIEKITGIPRTQLRPDIYPEE